MNDTTHNVSIPFLNTGNRTIDKAFRIAVGDLAGNIYPHRSGLLESEQPVIIAGIHYIEPWTRDAAFNAWNGAALMAPAVSKNTLLSTINVCDDGLARVGCNTYHYWDAIISVTGFWNHYLYTGDREFLETSFDVARNTMAFFEETEFDPDDGLFRGPACCMDAISAYPDELAYPVEKRSDYIGVLGCRRMIPPDKVPEKGMGVPFKALSTNCLYYEAYRNLEKMAVELEVDADPAWKVRAGNLKNAINSRFWLDDRRHYAYLVSCPLGAETCVHQEALGHSFAVLFGIADKDRAGEVLANQHLTSAGVPYIWPTFPRYRNYGENEYGRASGTVWPHAQAFWAEAALAGGRMDLFMREFKLMAKHAERDSHFAEVLHPDTEEIYGGVQEVNFTSKPRQTWCATGFIRMLLRGLLGMDFGVDGIRFSPCLPEDIDQLALSNLHYRGAVLRIAVSGHGSHVRKFAVNGTEQSASFISAELKGGVDVKIELGS